MAPRHIGDYTQAIDFLFTQLPVFQVQGAGAYKPGLQTTYALAEAFSNPQDSLRFIHIAGTNGKGSTASSLAAICSQSGLKTGLFTSPHLLDFRERIRIDGEMIPESEVIDFLNRYFAMKLPLRPTFFELTTVMALDWFRRSGVNIAVMEVGLGGRLDSTNIIKPELSIITNISLDHTALLGDTVEEIAAEKAGIIKEGVPVVMGQCTPAVEAVIAAKASECGAPFIRSYGKDTPYTSYKYNGRLISYDTPRYGEVSSSLTGDCQTINAATILKSVEVLTDLGLPLTPEGIKDGMEHVDTLTGLKGRWMLFCDYPRAICDAGHNPGAWEYLGPKLVTLAPALDVVIGFVGDKDVDSILSMLPKNARYYFTAPDIPRRLDPAILAQKALIHGLNGETYETVAEAWQAARQHAIKDGHTVFVGGSCFVVANLLDFISNNK